MTSYPCRQKPSISISRDEMTQYYQNKKSWRIIDCHHGLILYLTSSVQQYPSKNLLHCNNYPKHEPKKYGMTREARIQASAHKISYCELFTRGYSPKKHVYSVLSLRLWWLPSLCPSQAAKPAQQEHWVCWALALTANSIGKRMIFFVLTRTSLPTLNRQHQLRQGKHQPWKPFLWIEPP